MGVFRPKKIFFFSTLVITSIFPTPLYSTTHVVIYNIHFRNCLLGVPIFKGVPKVRHLRLIADKILERIDSWKGMYLSYTGRLALVKSIAMGS